MKLSQEEARSIYDSQESLKVMSGRYGSRVIGGADERTSLHVFSFQVREADTAFTTLTCTNGTTSYDVAYFLGDASGFIAGDTITAPEGFRFTVIELSAGSILVTGPNITGVVTP